MILSFIGYWCLFCFIISQLALFSKIAKGRKIFIHMASAMYAIAAGYLLK